LYFQVAFRVSLCSGPTATSLAREDTLHIILETKCKHLIVQ